VDGSRSDALAQPAQPVALGMSDRRLITEPIMHPCGRPISIFRSGCGIELNGPWANAYYSPGELLKIAPTRGEAIVLIVQALLATSEEETGPGHFKPLSDEWWQNHPESWKE